jgi:hypothetical protein
MAPSYITNEGIDDWATQAHGWAIAAHLLGAVVARVPDSFVTELGICNETAT